jgi:triacylglycerol lipase
VKIVLAHGVLGFDRFFGIEYFNGVARYLERKFRSHDLRVTTSKVPAIGSIEARAKELAPQIIKAADEEEKGKGKVHIFAHSMGGLDARCAIFKYGVAERVATLVTIGTPHHGSPVADHLDEIALPKWIDPQALRDLTTERVKQFDRETPDDTKNEIRYYYVAGDVSLPAARLSDGFAALAKIGRLTGQHDGVVSLESATRGNIKNLFVSWPVDHGMEVGWNLDRLRPSRLLFGLLPNPFAETSHLARYEELVTKLLLPRTR